MKWLTGNPGASATRALKTSWMLAGCSEQFSNFVMYFGAGKPARDSVTVSIGELAYGSWILRFFVRFVDMSTCSDGKDT